MFAVFNNESGIGILEKETLTDKAIVSNSSQATVVDRCLYISIYMFNSPKFKVVYTCHNPKYTYTELNTSVNIKAIQNKPLL